MKYIIGNWKANKTNEEVNQWIKDFNNRLSKDNHIQQLLNENKVTIIVCPPFPFIFSLQNFLTQMENLYIGSQDLSQFDEGSHTGEVTAKMLHGYIDFAIIGHSERRSKFNETEEMVKAKIEQAKNQSIKTVLCVRGQNDTIYQDASFVAYEPIEAIGSGMNKPVPDVLEMKKKLKLHEGQKFIYGGSVNPDNCSEYLNNKEIDGILPGKASLDANVFLDLALKIK
jgi:triosephosphate isomerase